MKCENSEDIIDKVFEENLEINHLDECNECREIVDDWVKIKKMLKNYKDVDLPVGFNDKMKIYLQKEKKKNIIQKISIVSSIAASILIIIAFSTISLFTLSNSKTSAPMQKEDVAGKNNETNNVSESQNSIAYDKMSNNITIVIKINEGQNEDDLITILDKYAIKYEKDTSNKTSIKKFSLKIDNYDKFRNELIEKYSVQNIIFTDNYGMSNKDVFNNYNVDGNKNNYIDIEIKINK